MIQTREDLCDKIAKLKSELAAYESDLKHLDDVVAAKVQVKVESMVGVCFVEDLYGQPKYYRIDSLVSVQDSSIDGCYAKLRCSTIFNPDCEDCYMQLEAVYFNERDLDRLKLISKEEFDGVVDKFINRFRGMDNK